MPAPLRLLAVALLPICLAAAPATAPSQKSPAIGEKIPSEDAVIKDLHSLGLINGHTNIFRSASPVRDLVKSSSTDVAAPSAALRDEARARMQHLHDLGIRTIISFENPDLLKPDETKSSATQRALWISLEKSAAADVGIAFISHPIDSSGEGSLETMTNQQVLDLLTPIAVDVFTAADKGGVLFHCAAGHDRTGLVAAFLRLKYQHWSVDQAIDEMRRLGHNWPKYSHDNGQSSWLEEHLRALAPQFSAAKN
jgi:hypothetical protein